MHLEARSEAETMAEAGEGVEIQGNTTMIQRTSRATFSVISARSLAMSRLNVGSMRRLQT